MAHIGSVRFGRLIAAASLLAGCLAASSLTATGAAAASRDSAQSDDVISYTLEGPPVTTHSFGYGKSDGSIPMGADTTRVVIVPTTEAVTPTVTCVYVFGYNDNQVAGEWTAQQWLNGEVSFEVDSSQVSLNQPWVQCKSWGAQERWEMGWSIDLVPTADEVLTLRQDPGLLNGEQVLDRYADSAAPRTVHPGDRVRVTGAPGSWTPVGNTQPYFNSELRDAYDQGTALEDLMVSADGSTVDFTVPMPWSASFFSDRPGYLQVVGTQSDPLLSSSTLWTAPVLIAKQPSVTSVALSNSVAVSLQRVVATARVVVDGAPVTEGTVAFTVDGVKVGSAALTDANGGRVSFKLPRLKRGSHSVVATYSGGFGIETSSRSTTLRIVL